VRGIAEPNDPCSRMTGDDWDVFLVMSGVATPIPHFGPWKTPESQTLHNKLTDSYLQFLPFIFAHEILVMP
jgi:hypothetical protein